MTTEPPPKNKIGAFIIGTCFGAVLSLTALWGFNLNGSAAVIAVASIAVPFGLIAAFACPKKFGKVITYFLTITNP
jgi:hypothetical protein